MHDARRERTHWCGVGKLVLVSSPDQLTARERKGLPAETAALLVAWPERLASMPPCFGWARELLRGRTPLLERAQFDDRVYWCVRLAGLGAASPFDGPCLGGDGVAHGRGLPAPLDWLAATFGTASLAAEQSGSAPWGRPLAAFREGGELLALTPFGDDAPALPGGSDAWVALHESDGDAVFADLETGRVHWVGAEWTGEPDRESDVPWQAVTSLVLSRMIDGASLRPHDLALLASLRA